MNIKKKIIKYKICFSNLRPRAIELNDINRLTMDVRLRSIPGNLIIRRTLR